MDKASSWLRNSLNYEFKDETLLQQALTHRSANGVNNERLEFLGDSVLQLVVSELVFAERTDASEGRLSRLRSLLVRDATLGELALEIGLGDHLILGSGEKKSGGHRRASILADSLEAVIGAIYLDSSLDRVRQVIHTALEERIRNLPANAELRDPKSRLQEMLQSRKIDLPEYAIENISGKAHRQTFEASCRIAFLELKTMGKGATRRDAEQEAATAALRQLDKQL